MYETHFGFNKRPFSLTPDTGLFVNLANHQHCLQLLQHVLESGEGFLKVIGEVGTGKTILCRKLLRFLESDQGSKYFSVYIPNPMLSPIGLYRAVAQELGLDLKTLQQDNDLLNQITDKILELVDRQQSVVIVVDEAQSLPAETLEALRLISNLETEETKLVQIILFGQTELDELLNEHRFRQLRQRITFSHQLATLSLKETQQYIEFRLNQCGYNGPTLFHPASLKRLHRASGGIPRMINVLAEKSLLAAFAENALQIKPRHIRIAEQDSQSANKAPTYWLKLTSVCLAVVLSAAVVWRLV